MAFSMATLTTQRVVLKLSPMPLFFSIEGVVVFVVGKGLGAWLDARLGDILVVDGLCHETHAQVHVLVRICCTNLKQGYPSFCTKGLQMEVVSQPSADIKKSSPVGWNGLTRMECGTTYNGLLFFYFPSLLVMVATDHGYTCALQISGWCAMSMSKSQSGSNNTTFFLPFHILQPIPHIHKRRPAHRQFRKLEIYKGIDEIDQPVLWIIAYDDSIHASIRRLRPHCVSDISLIKVTEVSHA